MLGISDAAESIGFRTSGVRISFQQLIEDVPLPCILHWQQRHFVVCYKIRKKRNKYFFHIADPATGLVTYHEEELKKFHSSLDVNEAEDAIYNRDLTDITDILKELMKDEKKKIRR